MKKINLHDVLETISVTAGEQGCDVLELTPAVIRMAAHQIDDEDVAGKLIDSAAEMDRPVTLSDVAASLRMWGVR